MNNNCFKKAVVIGLDGATFDVIFPLIEKNILPTFNYLIKNSAWSILKSTIPPLSAPAWISFMTGKNPASHGIFDFRNIDLSKLSCRSERIISSLDYKKDTIMDILSHFNKKVLAFQIPTTYPPWQINGRMLSGNPRPDFKKAYTYPQEWAKEIGNLSLYSLDTFKIINLKKVIKGMYYSIEKVFELANKFLEVNEYHMHIFVEGFIDLSQHLFWDKFGSNSDKDIVSLVYQKIDKELNNILKLIKKDTLLILMSDHGAGPRPRIYCNLNYWLKRKGLLNVLVGEKKINYLKKIKYIAELAKENLPIVDLVKKRFPMVFREKFSQLRSNTDIIDWKNTRAISIKLNHPCGAIVINQKERHPEGIVSSGREYEDLRKIIIGDLRQLKDPETNEDIIKKAYKKEEIYGNKNLENVPDIIYFLNNKYDVGNNLDSLIASIPKSFLRKIKGDHTMDGILIMYGGKLTKGNLKACPKIYDLAPTILYALGMPIPKRMDGRVLIEVFDEKFLEHNPVKYVDLDLIEKIPHAKLTEEEEEKMKEFLKNLGYM